jgi:hypothetical protein
MGGPGSVVMTAVGVLLIGVMNNGLGLLNVPIEMQLISKGPHHYYRLGHRQPPDRMNFAPAHRADR